MTELANFGVGPAVGALRGTQVAEQCITGPRAKYFGAHRGGTAHCSNGLRPQHLWPRRDGMAAIVRSAARMDGPRGHGATDGRGEEP